MLRVGFIEIAQVELLQCNAVFVHLALALILFEGLLGRLDSFNEVTHELDTDFSLLGVVVLDENLLG